ncbi:MAG: efflux RND transporter permease subunit [Actinophytocola sp.]|uniref:efflux RND transporter permease subunit n=1 Tax=Actinophytocola sp. TaxID=1872138 RepID=UPI003D6C501F
MSVLTKLSLANRSLIGLGALALTGFGALVIPTVSQELLPSLRQPAAVVVAPYPGASPDAVSSQVTEPIEESLEGTTGLKDISSQSVAGLASIQLQFDFGTDVEKAVQEMDETISGLADELPPDVTPSVSAAGGTDDIPAVVLAASSVATEAELTARLSSRVLPELSKIDGVRQVSLTGARTRDVLVTIDYAALAGAGLSPNAIVEALERAGTTTPAGTVTEADRTISVQVGDELESIDTLRELYLTPNSPKAKPVRLADVANVRSVPGAQTTITRTDSKPSLGISIAMKPDGNAVSVSHAVRDELASLGRSAGANLTVIFDQAPQIEAAIDGLTKEGLLGLGCATIAILVFLLSVRSTVITTVSIPLSVILALIALWIGDLSLNVLTLSALTIAVGRVVDDSIVVLENVKRQVKPGAPKARAILHGVKEVSGAVTASTLTTAAVFLPIAFVGGTAGQLLSPFAITVVVALLASLVVSLTVIPVLSYWFLRPERPPAHGGGGEEGHRDRLGGLYVPVVRFAVGRKAITLVLALAALAGTVGLMAQLETNFLDDSEGESLSITQALPAGSSLAARDEAAKRIERLLDSSPEVELYQATVGSDPAEGDVEGHSTFQATVHKGTDIAALRKRLRDEAGDTEGTGELSFGSQSGDAVSDALKVVVTAPDQEDLAKATDQVRKAMADSGSVSDVSSDLTQTTQRVQIDIDERAAANTGITPDTVGALTSQALGGMSVGEIVIAGERQEVLLRSGTRTDDVPALRALPVAGSGEVVPLSRVADIRKVEVPVKINRTDGEPSATITAKPVGTDLGAVNEKLGTVLDGLELAGGARYSLGGVSADQQEAFGDLGLALLAAIAIVFVIMVATFRSIVQPLILLVSIPFAATGAFGMLVLTDTPLGLPALIGLLMLVGIVVTNAIVLIDLVNQYRAQGMDVRTAVVEGGRRRLRPILMTALATIFAMIPMAIGFTGEGGFIGQPLALVVIGGLISSTLLTLLLVPTLYTAVENTTERLRARKQHRVARAVPWPPKDPDIRSKKTPPAVPPHQPRAHRQERVPHVQARAGHRDHRPGRVVPGRAPDRRGVPGMGPRPGPGQPAPPMGEPPTVRDPVRRR